MENCQKDLDTLLLANPNDKIEVINKYIHSYINIPFITYSCHIDVNNKTYAKTVTNDFITNIEPIIKKHNIKYILIANTDYFKTLTKVTKVEPYIGYVLTINNLNYVYIPPLKGIYLDPDKTIDKIQLALNSFLKHKKGKYVELGSNIIKNAEYPKSYEEKQNTLNKLLSKPNLTCDIETTSLRHCDVSLVSIAFADTINSGIAFKVNKEDLKLLKDFFNNYTGKLIFFNALFDVYILTYVLYMQSLEDYHGMYDGLDKLLRSTDDAMLLAYLAYNNCAGNKLSLKYLSQEFAGNYAQEDIANAQSIPEEQLLKYNLTDCLATWFVYNKTLPIVIKDKQLSIYNNIMIPALYDLITMQLVGLPINIEQVNLLNKQLQEDYNNALNKILNNKYIIEFTKQLKDEWVEEKNKKTRTKKKYTLDDCKIIFNPSSKKHMVRLLYDYLELPILNTTETNLPATDNKTLINLLDLDLSNDINELIQTFLDYQAVAKILSTYVPAFKKSVDNKLFGKQKLGGTITGRLSSKEPNLANLPSGSKYGKLVKKCFNSTDDWLFIGIDFASLEDRISALLTKDPEKLKIYTDGYDSHCYRAFKYFGNQMPDIKLASNDVKCFKITYDDGTIDYVTEKELNNL